MEHVQSIRPYRAALWVAAALYFAALWLYTLAPLPELNRVCVDPLFDPLASVRMIRLQPHSGFQLLGNTHFMQLAMNVALFIPFGVFVRLITGRGTLVALAGGFALSLSIELTQMTGVWGLHDCAHRFFDSADLILNSAGAAIGSLLAAAALKVSSNRSST